MTLRPSTSSGPQGDWESQKLPPAWLDELRGRVLLSGLVGQSVKLAKAGREFKGLCPFHSEKTGSFTVNDDKGFYHCFGCGAHGDALRWETDHNGKAFLDAAIDLADRAGLALPDGFVRHPGRGQRQAQDERVKRQSVKRDVPDHFVSSEEMGGVILERCAGYPRWPMFRYLGQRKVGTSLLAGRIDDLAFCPNAPVSKWDRRRGVESVGVAPAMVARLRRPLPELPVSEWPVTGLHVTYLNEDCTGKMVRLNSRREAMPARKMLGEVQGSAVVLGRYDRAAPLVVGEGIESTLSGLSEMIGLGLVPPDACAMAALSLNNLQGYTLTDRDGAWPIWNLVPDPARDALFFAHRGPVFVLVDADMKGLPVRVNGRGQETGPKLRLAARGRYEIRAVTGEERALWCATLARAGWLRAGVPSVEAFRPRLGNDFNDAAQSSTLGGVGRV